MEVAEATDSNFKEILEKNNKVIVKYYADWCGSCKLFVPKYKRLAADERFSEIKFLKVNAEENEEARQAAGVDNLPYFAVFRDGALVEGTATSKEEMVIKLLEKLK